MIWLALKTTKMAEVVGLKQLLNGLKVKKKTTTENQKLKVD